MGKQIHLKKIEELFDKSPVVDFKSIERVINIKNKSNYAKLLIYNLIKKNKIKRIGKGIYTKYSEISLSVFVFTPSYLGLQSALSFYGLWEQETIPVILTTKKIRRGIREIMGSNILVRNIDKKNFFGFEFFKEGNFYLPYSDLEKTFIDMVVFNQKMDKETINNVKMKINKDKLNKYLKKYNLRIKKRVENILKG
jgi:predicted transcriptional regulator of viral defense system